MAIRVEVWGDYALFSRPEMKTERVSYDVMTPSAARGIIEPFIGIPDSDGLLIKSMSSVLSNLPIYAVMKLRQRPVPERPSRR